MLKEMHVGLHVTGLLFLSDYNQDSSGLIHCIDTFQCQSLSLSAKQFLSCYMQICTYDKANGNVDINFSCKDAKMC